MGYNASGQDIFSPQEAPNVKPNVIVIHAQDNVAIALEDIPEGGDVVMPGKRVFPAREKIPYSHKVACEDIPAGGVVRKYGEPIGRASALLPKGSWVHIHNLDTEEAGS